MRKQMSESLSVGILLAVSGGLIDAYSYLYRGEVFANAQTGNVLLFSIHLAKGEWESALHYAFPIAAFLCGVALAVIICYLGRNRKRMHWRQICVLFEAVVLFSVAWIPKSANLLANSLISLVCGIQVETFRKIENASVATTMCIGNLRSAMHSAITCGLVGKRGDKHTAYISFVIVIAFASGAIMGSILIRHFDTYSVCCGTIIMLMCFFLMFFSPPAKRNDHIKDDKSSPPAR